MFVTQAEIEARLASDKNLLYLLRQSSKNEVKPEANKDSNTDESSFANPVANSLYEPGRLETRETLNADNDVEFERILDESIVNPNRDFNWESSSRIRSGRPNGAIDRSTEQRADIALMGTVLGHSLAANILGVSTASPSLHRRGVVSHGEDEDLDLCRVVKRKLNKIRDKSATAILRVLDHADSNQMYDQLKTAKDVAFVATQLAGVIQKVQPKEDDLKPTAQFVIIQPTVKTIEQYDVINV